jgi:hypothetical protein
MSKVTVSQGSQPSPQILPLSAAQSLDLDIVASHDPERHPFLNNIVEIWQLYYPLNANLNTMGFQTTV